MKEIVMVKTTDVDIVFVAEEDYARESTLVLDLYTRLGVRVKDTPAAARGVAVEIARDCLRGTSASIFGYAVHVCRDRYWAPYELRGPRGATFRLLRNIRDLHLFFVINSKSRRPSNIHGFEWFTDEGGTLCPLSLRSASDSKLAERSRAVRKIALYLS